MNDEQKSSLPSVPDADEAADEVVLSFQDGGLLIGGDPAAVESYLERLRTAAGHTVQVAGIDKASLGNLAGVAAGFAAIFGGSGKYVQLHPESLNALQNGTLIPGADGFYRMMTRGNDGQFLAQLQWRPTQLSPNVMLSAQMIAVQMALKAAIAEVAAAVRRVEGKVDAVLKLAQASLSGNVLGHNLTISRMVESLEKYGSLPDAYWDSVASLGPELNVTVGQLRNHVTRVLNEFDEKLPVQERADKLREANEEHLLGETLSLLVVAEESLYKWQRLNLTRVESTEPEHLLRAIDEARELLALHLREDAAVYKSAKEVLDRFAKPDAIEGFRFWSLRELTKQRSTLRDELDAFATARRHHVDNWEDFHIPGFLEAVGASWDRAVTTTGRALESAGEGLVRFGKYLAKPTDDAAKQTDPVARSGKSNQTESD